MIHPGAPSAEVSISHKCSERTGVSGGQGAFLARETKTGGRPDLHFNS